MAGVAIQIKKKTCVFKYDLNKILLSRKRESMNIKLFEYSHTEIKENKV